MRMTAKTFAREILREIDKKKIVIKKRDKNLEFLKKYHLKQKDVEEIIYALTEDMFKEKIKNKDSNIKAQYLYYFKAIANLNDEFGEMKKYIYIKICEEKENILVVSIHEDE